MLPSSFKNGIEDLSRRPGVIVRVPTQESAIGDVCRAIEAGERLIAINGGSGVGKSTVLAECVSRLRHPKRPVAIVDAGGTFDVALSLATTITKTARPLSVEGTAASWPLLLTALRICRMQEQAVILAIDDVHLITSDDTLTRLSTLVRVAYTQITVLFTTSSPSADARRSEMFWDASTIRLAPLTRSEAIAYLLEKFRRHPQTRSIFTRARLTQIHAHARGFPRMLDRLATQALSGLVAPCSPSNEIVGAALHARDPQAA